MCERLPIEILCEILRTAAEDFLPRDRQSVLNIALTATVAYGVAMPVLYRTLYADQDSIETALRVFGDGQSASSDGSGILRDPPSRRLCPLVRRLYLYHGHNLPIMDFQKLVNLERLLLYHGFLQPEDLEAVPPSVTHVGVLTRAVFHFATPSVTHVSYYWENRYGYVLDSSLESQVLDGLLLRPTASAVTHIALDLAVELAPPGVNDLRRTVQVILARPKTKILALHVLGEAAKPDNRRILLGMMRQVVRSKEDSQRVVWWFDPRSLDSEVEDIRVCCEEQILGRDVWTEGRWIELEERT